MDLGIRWARHDAIDRMTASDKAAATAVVLRVNGQMLVLTWLLVFTLAVLAGWLYTAAGAAIAAVGVAVGTGLALTASGLHTARVLARLSGFGYCGFWDHCAAVQLLYRQCVVLIAAALLAALAFWLA
jgi:hypothetical protein